MFILSLIVGIGLVKPCVCVCVCVCVCGHARARMCADVDFVMEVIVLLWWNIDSSCIFPHQNIEFDTVCRI
jgi:hypothetical protein